MAQPWPSWRADRWLEALPRLQRFTEQAIQSGLSEAELQQVSQILQSLAVSLPPNANP